MMASAVHDAAQRLALTMKRLQAKVVFAESCTGGLVAASLAHIPGISECLCGSAVTYRETTKIQWLGVTADAIAKHTAVSREVTRQMAAGVLRHTDEANWSCAVTGHLGPDAPTELDGIVFAAWARRTEFGIELVTEKQIRLKQSSRGDRLNEATQLTLAEMHQTLSGSTPGTS